MSNKEASKSVRHSIGIACIRVIDHIPQILLINKRYTYAYSEFVHGRYPYDKNYVMELFNRMTNAEKILILSLNFELIWYHIYLQDGGSKLRYIIARSKSINTLWQIPKGRKRSKNETDLCCAVREFKEETGIDKKSFYMFPNAKFTYSYEDNGIKYINTYYVAYTRNIFEPRVSMYTSEQIDEINDIRWMNIDEIRVVDVDGHITPIIRRMFKFIKRRLKDVGRSPK